MSKGIFNIWLYQACKGLPKLRNCQHYHDHVIIRICHKLLALQELSLRPMKASHNYFITDYKFTSEEKCGSSHCRLLPDVGNQWKPLHFSYKPQCINIQFQNFWKSEHRHWWSTQHSVQINASASPQSWLPGQFKGLSPKCSYMISTEVVF